MDEYPKMLFRFPGSEPMHGGLYASRVVADAAEEMQALADGWSPTTVEAKESHEARKEDARQEDEEASKEVLKAPLFGPATPPPDQPKRGPGRPPKAQS